MKLLTDFTAGELSPRFKGRIDLEITGKGCQEITNFVPFWPGGITVRPGTRFIDRIGFNKVRLIPFIVSDTVSYILELGNKQLRIWRNDRLLMSGDVPLLIETEYSDPFSLQFAQHGNEFFIAGGLHIFRLTYVDLDSFDYGQFIPEVGNKDMLPFDAEGDYPHCIAFHDGRLVAAASDLSPNTIWGSKTFDYANFTYFDTIAYTTKTLRDPYRTFQANTQEGSTVVTEVPSEIIEKLKAGDRISGDNIPEHPQGTNWQGASLYAALSSFASDTSTNASGTYDGKTITRFVRTSLSRAAIQSFDVGDGIGGGFLLWGQVFNSAVETDEPSALLHVIMSVGKTMASSGSLARIRVLKNGSALKTEYIYKLPYTLDLEINVAKGDMVRVDTLDYLTFGPRVKVSEATLMSAACTASFLYCTEGSVLRLYYSSVYTKRLTLTVPLSFDSNDYVDDSSTAEVFNRIVEIDSDNGKVTMAIPATGTGVGSVMTSWANPQYEEYDELTNERDVVSDDSAFKKEISGNERILWLAEGKDLIVGTTTSERVIPTGATSLNLTCPKQTAHGSAPIQPVMLNDAVIFVGADRKSLREYVYRAASSEAELYSAPRLDLNADHILTGTVQIDYSSSSTPFVWAVQADGTMIGCLRDRYVGLCAFFRVKLESALIESVCIIPENGTDSLYLSVNKDGARSLLKMDQLFQGMHLDYAAQVTVQDGKIECSWLNGAAAFVTGSAVYALDFVDGVASAGSLEDGTTGYVGYLFTATMKTMPIAENPLMSKQIPAGIIKVLDSFPFKFGHEGSLVSPPFVGKYSGDVELQIAGSWDSEGSVMIEQTALPLTVLAILLKSNSGG